MSTFVFHAPIGSYTLHFSEHEVASFSVLHALIIGRIGSLRRRCVLVKEVQGTSWGWLHAQPIGSMVLLVLSSIVLRTHWLFS